MVYDQHSVVINPSFKKHNHFRPLGRLDYGVDLGTALVDRVVRPMQLECREYSGTTSQTAKCRWELLYIGSFVVNSATRPSHHQL
jgi:hypothetical protein